MKIKFIMDKEYDIKISLQLKERVISRLKKLGYPVSTHMIRSLLEELYKKARTEMETKLLELQKSWNEIGEEFSEYIETTTNYKWFYPIYECVLLITLGGVSNWGRGPKIGVGYFLGIQEAKRVVDHEAILSHYFEIYRRYYADENLRDGQVWALAEISAFALTSLTDKAKNSGRMLPILQTTITRKL
jgi:hypothetical protein